MSNNKKKVVQFDQDVTSHGSYLYTLKASKSSRLANKRLTEITKTVIKQMKGKKVIDVGCGDGAYTAELFQWGKPEKMVGVDASKEAIKLANKSYKSKSLLFEHHRCQQMPYRSQSFDIAIVRGLLHHLDKPFEGLMEIVRIANRVLIIEPNGYNPILKLIEKISPYHRRHQERSFTPITIRDWIGKQKGKITKEIYVGLVPFFCPDWLAELLKKMEPLFEKTPVLRNFFCGVYIIYFKNN